MSTAVFSTDLDAAALRAASIAYWNHGGRALSETSPDRLRAAIRAYLAALPSEIFLAVGAPAQTLKPCEKHPERYCNCEGFYPACREAPASSADDVGRPVPKHGSGP